MRWRWLREIGELAVCPLDGGPGEIGRIERAAIAWDDDGRIVWVGPESDAPPSLRPEDAVSAEGGLVIPGLVDSHTHLAFAGWRVEDFSRTCAGASYQEIAASGGGILRTVRLTREASEDDLVERGLTFLREMTALGVTTVEAKTGYGLTIEHELRLLRVYRRIAERSPLTLVPTLLAHIAPLEEREDREGYIQRFCEDLIPRAAHEGSARFCDVFVEEGAFTVEEARRILRSGLDCGLGAKVHADQLSDGGGARLAAELGAVSADHLEKVSDSGLDAMAERGVIATLLPIASLYLRQPPLDARRLTQRGIPVAIATDFNPGSAPSYHLPFAMTSACLQSGLTPAEALQGATVNAARALRLEDRVGSLGLGRRADIAVIDAPNVEHWLYQFRPNAVRAVFVRGQRLVSPADVFPPPLAKGRITP